MFLIVLVEPKYVDGENESEPMRSWKACVASKLHWENSADETMVDSRVHTAHSD